MSTSLILGLLIWFIGLVFNTIASNIGDEGGYIVGLFLMLIGIIILIV